jgi:hypothetical protein
MRDQKYDATAAAMIAMPRFGVGLPHPRIEKLQAGFGIALPSSTDAEAREGQLSASSRRPMDSKIQRQNLISGTR